MRVQTFGLRVVSFVSVAVAIGSAASPARGQDWTNAGGNAGRNGRTTEIGPDGADVLWTGGRSSIIA